MYIGKYCPDFSFQFIAIYFSRSIEDTCHRTAVGYIYPQGSQAGSQLHQGFQFRFMENFLVGQGA
jgi:hypothetical protein